MPIILSANGETGSISTGNVSSSYWNGGKNRAIRYTDPSGKVHNIYIDNGTVYFGVQFADRIPGRRYRSGHAVQPAVRDDHHFFRSPILRLFFVRIGNPSKPKTDMKAPTPEAIWAKSGSTDWGSSKPETKSEVTRTTRKPSSLKSIWEMLTTKSHSMRRTRRTPRCSRR